MLYMPFVKKKLRAKDFVILIKQKIKLKIHLRAKYWGVGLGKKDASKG